jgi:hypothetical protein
MTVITKFGKGFLLIGYHFTGHHHTPTVSLEECVAINFHKLKIKRRTLPRTNIDKMDVKTLFFISYASHGSSCWSEFLSMASLISKLLLSFMLPNILPCVTGENIFEKIKFDN